MKFILCLLMIIISSGFASSDAFAETWYYYVEPLPNYASYATNVMDLSTTAWEDANDDLEFIEVTSPEQANFQVQWVKEFGVEHVGYAYGSWFIEVGLGDSNCGTGMWQPYSEKYTTHIMTHEIGHVLGWDHVDDPDSIMYPVALNWEYGIVETSKTLTNDYGYFSPICTSKDSTTFNWHVSSDDPTYGFDVYFVPSIDEFDSWVEDGTFSYFDDTGCFAENMISVGGTCEGVTSESGLLVLMGDKATEPLTEITLAVQENNLGYDINSNDVTKGSSILNPADSIDIDRTFTLYADPQQEFSVNYPSNWLINKDGEFLLFSDDYNWTAQIQIADFSEGIDGEFDIDNAMDGITTYVQESCENATIEKDGHVCYDFQLQTSAQKFNFPSHETVYFIEYSDTQQYDLISGHKETMKTILTLIYNDSKVWLLVFNVDSNVSEEYFDVFFEIVSSFKIIKSGEESSTTKSSATPIPTPQPEVITSVGSAVLSKTSVDVGYEQSEQVKVYGTINNVNKSTRVNITYTYPDGTTNGVQVFTTDSGVYETVLDLDTNSPKGVYEILVTSKNKVIGILELEVVEKKLEAPPSPKVVATDTEKDPIESPTILEKPKFSFVDESKDPWSYVDRYHNEASYKEWFDENYPDYTIYEAVNLKNPLDFVDNSKDPQSYVDRYHNEASYKEWFDENYPDYTIYEAVGLEDPIEKMLNELPEGILISGIMENYGAEKAGLLVGDIIVTINGKVMHGASDLPHLNSEQIANIEVLRGGETLEFDVEIMPNPDDLERGLIGIYGNDSINYDRMMENKSLSEDVKSFSNINLLEGQWIEYDFNMKFDGDGSAAKIIENVMMEGLQESNTLNFNPFDITKLRFEVIKITDYTVILDYTMTLQDDSVLVKNYVIHPDTTPDMFNSVFIEIPAPKELMFDINSNLFFIDTMFEGTRNISLKKIEIPTFLYTGYNTENDLGIIKSYNSELNFEKDTGILLKSAQTMTVIGTNEFFEELDYQISMERSVTDYHIPNQKNMEKTEQIPSVIDDEPVIDTEPTCGVGTTVKDGICVVDTSKQAESSSKGGGCLIATATYGSELAPEVQKLRELRDNSLLSTESGTNFMNTFNDVYYSFSPLIADYERENPAFKEMVKMTITPMITSLSLMEYAETESEVLGIGISLIILNVMMYVGIPVFTIMWIRK